MQHLDPESVSLAALGEELDGNEQAHLADCETCALEVEDLSSVVLVARRETAGEPLDTPDPGVWAAIHQELGLHASQAEDPLRRASSEHHGRGELPPRSEATVVDLRQRRARRPSVARRYLLGAAAAGIVVGGGAFWAVQSLVPGPSREIVAEVVLEPLEGFTAEGTAAVVYETDGLRSLDVTSTGNEADGYEEVWLIAPELDRMYSLGVLRDGTGSLTIPDSIDLEEFPIVDISDEPLDGDPTHSGVSVLRGNLTATTSQGQN